MQSLVDIFHCLAIFQKWISHFKYCAWLDRHNYEVGPSTAQHAKFITPSSQERDSELPLLQAGKAMRGKKKVMPYKILACELLVVITLLNTKHTHTHTHTPYTHTPHTHTHTHIHTQCCLVCVWPCVNLTGSTPEMVFRGPNVSFDYSNSQVEYGCYYTQPTICTFLFSPEFKVSEPFSYFQGNLTIKIRYFWARPFKLTFPPFNLNPWKLQNSHIFN